MSVFHYAKRAGKLAHAERIKKAQAKDCTLQDFEDKEKKTADNGCVP